MQQYLVSDVMKRREMCRRISEQWTVVVLVFRFWTRRTCRGHRTLFSPTLHTRQVRTSLTLYHTECVNALFILLCVCVSSAAGGKATAAEEKQRAEERVRSSGGTRQEAQQDAQSKNTTQPVTALSHSLTSWHSLDTRRSGAAQSVGHGKTSEWWGSRFLTVSCWLVSSHLV